MAEHAPDWGPSSFPAWGICADYEGSKEPSAAGKAGSELHEKLQHVLMGMEPPMSNSDRKIIGPAVNLVRQLEEDFGPGTYEERIGGLIKYTEHTSINTFGTPDVIMTLDGICVYDMKSGQYDDSVRDAYLDQTRVYGVLKAFEEKAPPFSKIKMVIHFPRVNKVITAQETVGECHNRVKAIIVKRLSERGKDKRVAHKWCPYCIWKDTCATYEQNVMDRANQKRTAARQVTFLKPEGAPEPAVEPPLLMSPQELESRYIEAKAAVDTLEIIRKEIVRRHKDGQAFSKLRVYNTDDRWVVGADLTAFTKMLISENIEGIDPVQAQIIFKGKPNAYNLIQLLSVNGLRGGKHLSPISQDEAITILKNTKIIKLFKGSSTVKINT